MNEIPWNSILPLVGVAIGFGGNVAAQHIQHSREDKRTRDERSLAKLQDLISLLNKYQSSVEELNKAAVRTLLLDEDFNPDLMLRIDPNTLDSVFAIYAPELRDQFNDLGRYVVNEIVEKTSHIPDQLGSSRDERNLHVDELQNSFNSFIQNCGALRNDVVELITSRNLV